jgi:outer membrane protein assembly factor BamD (BamD/ComL family)
MDYDIVVREISMKKVVMGVLVTGLSLAGVRTAFCAQTFRIDDRGRWTQTTGNDEEQFLLRVAEMKKLVDEGKPGKVKKAAKQLKADFPQIAGEDFNAFVAAEVLLAKGKLTDAVRGYNKLLDEYPKSNLRDAALERQFQVATEYLAGRKKRILPLIWVRSFDEGVKIMEKISDRTGSADIAKRALLAAVKSYESRKMYNEAYLEWSQISTRWPTGQTGRDALLGMARNKYATYRGPQYDGSGLISAKSYYENFKLRYPQDAKELKVDEILTKINEQLAEKNLLIARYYGRTGSVEQANMYNQMVLDTWPNTKAAQEARQAIGKKN